MTHNGANHIHKGLHRPIPEKDWLCYLFLHSLTKIPAIKIPLSLWRWKISAKPNSQGHYSLHSFVLCCESFTITKRHCWQFQMPVHLLNDQHRKTCLTCHWYVSRKPQKCKQWGKKTHFQVCIFLFHVLLFTFFEELQNALQSRKCNFWWHSLVHSKFEKMCYCGFGLSGKFTNILMNVFDISPTFQQHFQQVKGRLISIPNMIRKISWKIALLRYWI